MPLIKKSIFQFDDFMVLKYHCDFIDPGVEKAIQIKEITDQYVVELDFTFVDKESEKKTLIYCKAIINPERKLPGYSIIAEGVGIFKLGLGKDLPSETFSNDIVYSAVSHGINQIRNYIMIATTQGPFGKYQFPLIDLGDLIKNKIEQKPKVVGNSETIPRT